MISAWLGFGVFPGGDTSWPGSRAGQGQGGRGYTRLRGRCETSDRVTRAGFRRRRRVALQDHDGNIVLESAGCEAPALAGDAVDGVRKTSLAMCKQRSGRAQVAKLLAMRVAGFQQSIRALHQQITWLQFDADRT